MNRKTLGVLAAVAVVLISALGIAMWHSQREATQVPGALRAPLNARATRAVEEIERAAMCSPTDAATCEVRCAVTVFGMDPMTAAQADGVNIAYADMNCQTRWCSSSGRASLLVFSIR